MPRPLSPPRLRLVDNLDSFTFMLADSLRQVGAEVEVVRNDAMSVEDALADVDGIVISPGPGHPTDSGISLALTKACIQADRPFLGVCLGHQALGLAFGGPMGRTAPIHGKVEMVTHHGDGLFSGLPSPTPMTRYHSLCVVEAPSPLRATAWSTDGTLMAMAHPSKPFHGVQFHPESVASDFGLALLRNFVGIVVGTMHA